MKTDIKMNQCSETPTRNALSHLVFGRLMRSPLIGKLSIYQSAILLPTLFDDEEGDDDTQDTQSLSVDEIWSHVKEIKATKSNESLRLQSSSSYGYGFAVPDHGHFVRNDSVAVAGIKWRKSSSKSREYAQLHIVPLDDSQGVKAGTKQNHESRSAKKRRTRTVSSASKPSSTRERQSSASRKPRPAPLVHASQ